MPAFIKSPADEKKWNAIKHSVAKQRGKNVADFTDRDWATVNAAWHKSEGQPEELTKSISTKVPTTSIPNPARVGSTAVKMPRQSKMPDPYGKPSLFFKKEDFDNVKQTSIEKLRVFLEGTRAK